MPDPIATAPPRVSMVIPAYNCQGTIAAAVRSCLDQTCDAEVIVVDDGSTDATTEVLAGFGERIRVVSQPNGGLAAARNAGTRAARGEFIAWMDADDLATPHRVAVQAEVLAADPRIAAVSSDFSAFTSEDADFDASHIGSYYDAYARLGGAERIYARSTMQHLGGHRCVVRSGPVYEQLLWGNFVHPPTVMTRREFLDRAGAFDERLRYSSDYDLLLRLARLGEFAFVEAPLLRYRRSPEQMSGHASRGAMPLETVRILDKVRHSDPALYARCAPLFRLRTAESLVSAASAIGPTARREALGLLWEGLRHRIVVKPALVALLRIALPDGIRRALVASWRRVARDEMAHLTTGASTAATMIQELCLAGVLPG